MLSLPIIEKIREKLKSVDESKRTTFLVLQFHFNKPDGSLIKSFVVDLKELKLYEGTTENPDNVITVTDEDFYAFATKKIPFDEFKTKIQVTGDVEAVKKLLDYVLH